MLTKIVQNHWFLKISNLNKTNESLQILTSDCAAVDRSPDLGISAVQAAWPAGTLIKGEVTKVANSKSIQKQHSVF